MPPITDEQTHGKVVREWILGFPRDAIAEQNGIGTGTVSNIITNCKAGLESVMIVSKIMEKSLEKK
jgi:hypothetical protein